MTYNISNVAGFVSGNLIIADNASLGARTLTVIIRRGNQVVRTATTQIVVYPGQNGAPRPQQGWPGTTVPPFRPADPPVPANGGAF